MLRALYRLLGIFALFKSTTSGGAAGFARNRGRRVAHRALSRSMKKWGL